jgi:O-antigen ligase
MPGLYGLASGWALVHAVDRRVQSPFSDERGIVQRVRSASELSLGIGAAVLGVALALAASIGLSSPPSELPLPAGLFAVGAVAGQLVLLMLPWRWQFGLVAAVAAVQIATIGVGGATVPITVVLITPFAVRVLLFTRREVRPRWSWPEYVILSWVALQYVSTALFSLDKTASLESAALLTLGVGTYLVVYTGACTRERVVFAVRLLLLVSVLASLLALMAYAAYLAFGSTLGMAFQPEIGYLPRGIAFEPNLLGSTSAGAAVAFLVLMHERNAVVHQAWAVIGYWICLGAMAISLARGAALGFAIAFVASFLLRGRDRRDAHVRLVKVLPALTVIGGVAAVTLALAVAAPDTALGDIRDQLSTKWEGLMTGQGTVGQRLGETVLGFEDLDRSPVIGLGTDSFGQRHVDYTLNPPGPAYLGNLYFRTLYDTGVAGLVLLALFLASVVWPSGYLRTGRSDLAPVARALILGYLAMAVAYAATDGSLLAWPWVFIGLARAARWVTAREVESVSIA